MLKLRKYLAYPFVSIGILFLVAAFLIHGRRNDKFGDWFDREVKLF